jgi:hypothetical protein
MVKVAAYDEQSLSSKMASVNDTMSKYSTSEPEDLRLKAAKLQVMLKLYNGLNGGLWGGATAVDETDIDGKFQIKLPHDGKFAFFAFTKRQTPLGNEPYLFFKRCSFTGAGDYKIEMNNTDEEISDYTSDWAEEYKALKFNEMSDYDWQSDVLFWIMKGNYGLQYSR